MTKQIDQFSSAFQYSLSSFIFHSNIELVMKKFGSLEDRTFKHCYIIEDLSDTSKIPEHHISLLLDRKSNVEFIKEVSEELGIPLDTDITVTFNHRFIGFLTTAPLECNSMMMKLRNNYVITERPDIVSRFDGVYKRFITFLSLSKNGKNYEKYGKSSLFS